MPADTLDTVRHAAAARADAFLRELADPARPPIAANEIALVLAHPDDETIACGAQLPRLQQVTIVTVTDGAPRNLVDARARGFDTADAYAAARRRELLHALALADVPDTAFIGMGVPDQGVASDLPAITRRLCDLISRREVRLVLTHAFEGGHPDHDATAFAVHAAAALLNNSGHVLAIVEAPLYRQGPSGPLYQSFAAHADLPETTIALTPSERSLKEMMLAAFATQQEVLAPFTADCERFRRAPRYDFGGLPNEGRLNYEQQDWGMTGERWRKLVEAACRELGLDPVL
jgi:LmbE family N-acetylglucosaminyl deacetylase